MTLAAAAIAVLPSLTVCPLVHDIWQLTEKADTKNKRYNAWTAPPVSPSPESPPSPSPSGQIYSHFGQLLASASHVLFEGAPDGHEGGGSGLEAGPVLHHQSVDPAHVELQVGCLAHHLHQVRQQAIHIALCQVPDDGVHCTEKGKQGTKLTTGPGGQFYPTTCTRQASR